MCRLELVSFIPSTRCYSGELKSKSLEAIETKTCAASLPMQGATRTKGVYMGWKQGNKSKIMSLFMKEYLLKYWRKEGLLNNNTKQFFHMETEKMPFVVFNGIGYKVGDLVVLRTDDMESNVFFLHLGIGHGKLRLPPFLCKNL
jgi:hypothetical protein